MSESLRRVVVTAPGKLVIAGEYVVLDGAEALVAAVDRRLRVVGSARAGDGSAGPRGGSPDAGGLPPEALLARRHAESALGEVAMDLSVDAHALAQDGKKLGLGSSSAASAAAAGAVVAWRGGDPAAERRRILGWALAGHRAIAPEGSGVDVAAATLGGFVRLCRDRVEEAAPLAWPRGVEVEVVWTGTPARTSELVRRVKALETEAPARYRARMDALREAAADLIDALSRGDAPAVAASADAHGRAMGALGEAAGAPIVTDALAGLAALARACGGGAKPSGAGGGDVALAFFTRPEDAARFRARCTEAGLTLLSLTLGAEGVRAEER
ncbi:MAG: hypothetical protein KF729_06115 [Sandaracinaceae bacterium]|nr:hypothetical protein [Sandaracinaceae bacterium]